MERAAVEALLLRHEAALPTVMRQVVQVLRAQVETYFDDASPQEHLLVGAAVLRMILIRLERKCGDG